LEKYRNEWADALQLNKKVKVKITAIYEGNSLRPAAFEIDEWIDEIKVEPKKTFTN